MRFGRVVYFEDNAALADSVKMGLDLFSDSRHQVVAHAADLSGALAVLDQIAVGEIEANIVMTDGSLTGDVGTRDAKTILERVHELHLPVRTLFLSSQSAEGLGVSVDVVFPKDDTSVSAIVEAIDGFPEIGTKAV